MAGGNQDRGSGKLIADVQVLSLAAGAALATNTTGTNTVGTGSVQITPNSITSLAVKKSLVWDGILLRVFPGVLANGATEPDLKMWVEVDDQSYQSWFYADISVSGNMFPRREFTVGNRREIYLGKSLVKALAKAQVGLVDHPGAEIRGPKNMPMLFTGWKISNTLTFVFYSAAGFSASDFVVPPRVQLWGDVIDAELLDQMSALIPWSGKMVATSERRVRQGLAPFQGTHTFPGFSLAKWGAMPGGPLQGLTRVQRYFRHSFNALEVDGTTPYVLSKIQSIGGNADNIAAHQDLGYDYTNTGNMLQILEFGRRPGAGAGYWGLDFGNNEVYPFDTTYGAVLTEGNNPIQFGQVQPTRSESGLYFPMPRWGDWDPESSHVEVIADETVAFFIAAKAGSTVAANADETAVGGVQVTQTGLRGGAQPGN